MPRFVAAPQAMDASVRSEAGQRKLRRAEPQGKQLLVGRITHWPQVTGQHPGGSSVLAERLPAIYGKRNRRNGGVQDLHECRKA